MAVLSLLLFFCLPVYATPASDFVALLNQTHTMRADIVQTMKNQHNSVTQVAYGKMALMRPYQFRWEILKPIPQLVIVNNQEIIVYDSDLAQVTMRTLHATALSGTLFLSASAADIEQSYIVTSLQEDAAHRVWFLLKPRHTNDATFSSIAVGFLKGELQAMRLEDHLGHVSVIELKHVQKNIALPRGLFAFKIPKQVDVIDERQ